MNIRRGIPPKCELPPPQTPAGGEKKVGEHLVEKTMEAIKAAEAAAQALAQDAAQQATDIRQPAPAPALE